MGEQEARIDVRAVQREMIARLLQGYFQALKESENVEELLVRLKKDIEGTLERFQKEENQ